jgi:uncharacterized membrane protein
VQELEDHGGTRCITAGGSGVIGAVVGAYFGVRAANRAVDKMKNG